MKKSVVFILALTSTTCFSQINVNDQQKFKVGISFTPDLYLNSVAIAYNENLGFQSLSAELNYTAGVVGKWNILPKLELGSGISYSKKDFTGTFFCHLCDFIVPPQPEKIKHRYLEVPLTLRYTILQRKIYFHMETGIITGALINNPTTLYTGPLYDSKLLLSGRIGGGVNIDVGESMNIGLTSSYQHSFRNPANSLNLKLRSIGLMAQLLYKL